MARVTSDVIAAVERIKRRRVATDIYSLFALLLRPLAPLRPKTSPLYRPEKHYMRGPGPACKANLCSSQQMQSGGDSRFVVASSDQTRATPDTRSKQCG